jgi:predicted ATPase
VLTTLAVANYRSLRFVVLPLARLTVVTGANGTGKSSLYRSLRLLADVALGRIVGSIAREGGMPSTLWAGAQRISAVRERDGTTLQLGYAGDELGYQIDLGYPSFIERPTSFKLDPVIKSEVVFAGPIARPASRLVQRIGAQVQSRDDDGRWSDVGMELRSGDSMLTELADPRRTPELFSVRERIRSWRFYDAVRTDPDAPARRPRIGTFTPVLASDGSDLPAAIQTIVEIGDAEGLNAAVEEAFPGSRIAVVDSDGYLTLTLSQPGLVRPLSAAELSDGTLRYLLWVAALLTPRPPELMVLNEPESSLHPDVLPALARLIVQASEHTQIVVVSHAGALVAELAALSGPTARGGSPAVATIELSKDRGETTIAGQHGLLDKPAWIWVKR